MWKAIDTFVVKANVALAKNCSTDQRFVIMEAKLDFMMKKCKLFCQMTQLRTCVNVACVHDNQT